MDTTVALIGGVLVLGVVAVTGGLLINLARQNGRLLLRIENLEQRIEAAGLAPAGLEGDASSAGLRLGSEAPTFSLPGLRGETLTLDFLRSHGKPLMLLFTHPGCGPCEALLPEVKQWQRLYANELTFALISEGSVDENAAKYGDADVPPVLLQQGRDVADAYGVTGTPSALIVEPDGEIGSHVAAGAEPIRALIHHRVQTPEQPDAAAEAPAPGGEDGADDSALPHAIPLQAGLGRPAPSLTLKDLKGIPVDIGSLRGHETLLLFWNPGCGFCQQMLDDLKAWEAQRPKDAPKLVVVSTGDIQANRALGLRSRILLDPDFSAAIAFGANGTPMAVLLDEDGKVVSSVAAGAPAVMALARGGRDQQAKAAAS